MQEAGITPGIRQPRNRQIFRNTEALDPAGPPKSPKRMEAVKQEQLGAGAAAGALPLSKVKPLMSSPNAGSQEFPILKSAPKTAFKRAKTKGQLPLGSSELRRGPWHVFSSLGSP